MKSAILVLLLTSALPVMAQSVDGLPNEELCVLYSLTLATGEATYAGTQQQIKEQLTSRSETCQPQEVYMQAALQRAKNLQAKAELDSQVARDNAQAAQLNQIYEEQARAERSERRRRALLDFSRQMQSQPQVRTPSTTNCIPTYGGGVNCTTF